MAQGRWNEQDQQGWRRRDRDRDDQERYGGGEDRSFGRGGDIGYGSAGYDFGPSDPREQDYGGRRYGEGAGYGQGSGQDSGRGGYRQQAGRYGQGGGYEQGRYGGAGRYGQGYGGGYGGGEYDEARQGYGQGGRGSYDRGYGGEGYGARGGGQRYRDRDEGDRGDRGFWDRTRDEVSSWMGDDDARMRRQQDQRAESHRGRGPKNYTRSDDRIRDDVNDRLTDDPSVDASEIEVQVKDREVTLSGTVDSREAKRRAEDCAEQISGVTHVQNNLRVQQSGAASGATGSANARGASGANGGSAAAAGATQARNA